MEFNKYPRSLMIPISLRGIAPLLYVLHLMGFL
jgi:hypothetical protein